MKKRILKATDGTLVTKWVPESAQDEQELLSMAERGEADAAFSFAERRAMGLGRSDRDALTGALNRKAFMTSLAELQVAGLEQRFAVLFVDIDNFKGLNDQFGHLVGDKVLVGVARRIESVSRPYDEVARIGGEEFAILLHDCESVSVAQTFGDILLEALRVPFFVDNSALSITCSLGIAVQSCAGDSLDVFEQSDVALHRAKTLGKNQLYMFGEDSGGKLQTA